MNHPDPAAAYVTAVVTLYIEMPDTPMRVSASDQWLARHFHKDGVPLETVETALLLGSLRRLIRPADAPSLSPIRSLAYFRPVVEELQQQPVSLRMGLCILCGVHILAEADAKSFLRLIVFLLGFCPILHCHESSPLTLVPANSQQLLPDGVLGYEAVVVERLKQRHAWDSLLRNEFIEMARVERPESLWRNVVARPLAMRPDRCF